MRPLEFARGTALALLLALFAAPPASAQNFTYRGFGEGRAIFYPQTTKQDDDHVALDARGRFEPAYKATPWLTLTGSVEGRIDNLHQVERTLEFDWLGRDILRPALAIRQASATLRTGHLALDLGKQFVRWGKADILAPTDRFAPRDYVEVTVDEFLAVTAARVQWTTGSHSFDAVVVPSLTPSRLPLFDRRWAPVPENSPPVVLSEDESLFPRRAQFGARWNLVEPGFDLSVSYFDGFNHVPELVADPVSIAPSVLLVRSFQPLRTIGGDASVPLRWFTIKGEAAYFRSDSAIADNLVIYVIQLERQAGELSLVGGYAGESITEDRSSQVFSPERGLARSFLGRASYTIDANRSASLEVAVRQSGEGLWLKGEYSQARGAHWRTTVAGTFIAGAEDDFFGQYNRNSHLLATLRYSF